MDRIGNSAEEDGCSECVLDKATIAMASTLATPSRGSLMLLALANDSPAVLRPRKINAPERVVRQDAPPGPQ